MDFLMNAFNWISGAIRFVSTVVINYPRVWICTYWIRRKIKKEATPVILDANKVIQLIQKSIRAGLLCRIELTDRAYILPKRDWIRYIADNIWEPYKRIRQVVYGRNFDCDNFSVSFFNLVQELMLGLCIGIAHYGFIENGTYKAHAVACFIPEEAQYLWLLEPQSTGFDAWILNIEREDLIFIYLEGQERFN